MVLPVPIKILDQHVIALGKTRSGKSSVLRLLVEHLLDHEKPVCIIDPKGDWWGLKSSANGKSAGYPVVIFGGPHADVPINAHSGNHVAELVATGNRPCIIDLKGWMPGDRTRFFVDFASTLFRFTQGIRWLVIDEVHNFAPQGKVLDPQAGKMLHWANRLISEGSGMGITLLSASQRPQKVHKDFVTSNETLIALRVIHKLDRDADKDWIDGCADPQAGKDVLTSLASLKRGEAWVWSPEIEFGPKRVQFPLFKTYDSFKAQDSGHVKLKGWAEVDLEDVRAKLVAVVEEAKANDPSALKAEVARLNAELKKTITPANAPIPEGPAALKDRERAFAAGRKEGREIAYVEGWTAGHEVGFKAGFLATATEADSSMAEVVEAMASLRQAFRSCSMHVPYVAPKPPRVPKEPAAPVPAPTEAEVAADVQRVRELRSPVVVPRTDHRPPVDREFIFSKPQSAILASLAWWAARGFDKPTRVQVGIKAGMKARGGHFKTRMSELSGRGLITYEGADSVSLTSEGRYFAPPPDEVSAMDTLRPLLSEPQRKIFEALVPFGPDEAAMREDIAARAGIDHKGGHFKTRMSELSSWGIVYYPSSNTVAVNSWVFK